MIGLLNKTITKIFGSKSDKDLKEIVPQINKIKEEFVKLGDLSNDALRSKTHDFKNRISEHLKETNDQISNLEKEAEENFDIDLHRKEEIYKNVDQLKKEIKSQTE